MRKRFGCVIAQPGGDWNPRVTVDHKGVVGVVDDARKFHLQNSIELLDDWTDFKTVCPYHRDSPSSWRPLTGRSCDKALSRHVGASRCRNGVAEGDRHSHASRPRSTKAEGRCNGGSYARGAPSVPNIRSRKPCCF